MLMYQISLVILILGGALIGYLFGSIIFAIIISKTFTKSDIRTKGSNNPGFTNSIRVYGTKIAIIVLILDILKAIIPTLIFYFIYRFELSNYCSNYVTDFYDPKIFIYIPGVFAVIGHIFPIYFKFKGGKGVATYGGLCICLSPFIALIGILIIIIVVLTTKKMAIGSLLSSIVIPFLILVPGINYLYLMNFDLVFFITKINSLIVKLLPLFGMLLFLSLLVIYSHRGNIKKIINKTENNVFEKKEKLIK